MRQSGQQAWLGAMQNDRDSEAAVLFVLPKRMIHAWTCCVTDSAVGAPCDHVCDQHKYSITRGTWCRAPGIIHANGSRPGAKVLPGTSRYAGRGRPGFCPDINKKISCVSLRKPWSV